MLSKDKSTKKGGKEGKTDDGRYDDIDVLTDEKKKKHLMNAL